MRITDTPKFTPARCAITGLTEGPFIDTGICLPIARPYIYVSIPGAIKVGRFAGMVDAEDHQAVTDERDALAAEVEELRAQVEHYEKFEEGVKFTLNQFNVPYRDKPGPKPKS